MRFEHVPTSKGLITDTRDQPIKDELLELNEAVSKATDAHSIHRAVDQLAEYLTRQKDSGPGTTRLF
jgi:hypothetical protein